MRDDSLVAAPLDSHQQHDDAGGEKNKSKKIKFVMEIFDDFPSRRLDYLSVRDLGHEKDSGDDSAWRQVDVKAPAPSAARVSKCRTQANLIISAGNSRCVLCQSASDQRSNDSAQLCDTLT